VLNLSVYLLLLCRFQRWQFLSVAVVQLSFFKYVVVVALPFFLSVSIVACCCGAVLLHYIPLSNFLEVSFGGASGPQYISIIIFIHFFWSLFVLPFVAFYGVAFILFNRFRHSPLHSLFSVQ
jgi:hypothetical protein